MIKSTPFVHIQLPLYVPNTFCTDKHSRSGLMSVVVLSCPGNEGKFQNVGFLGNVYVT